MNIKKIKQSFSAVRLAMSLALMTVFTTSLGFFSATASAADTPAYRLQISPTQSNLGEIDPGGTYTGKVKVQNTGTDDFDFKVNVAPYTVQSDQYDPDYTTVNEYTEITDWITLSTESGHVEAGSQEEVEFTVKVPDNAPGKAQSAALLVSLVENDDSDATSVQTIRQAAFPIFANVTGDTRKTAEIVSNRVPNLLFTPPVTASSVVKNTGNVYTVAEYTLDVKSFFGGKDVFTTPEEDRKEIIFPDTERYNEVSWEGAPQIGLFKVKQTVKIFDEVSEVEKVVFLCPLWFSILIIAIIGVIIFWIVSRILKRKSA